MFLSDISSVASELYLYNYKYLIINNIYKYYL